MRALYYVVLIVILGVVGWFVWSTSSPREQEISNTIENVATTTQLSLTSSAFAHGGSIPARYTCDENRGLNPPLTISGVPEGTVSLVLIMDDPDVPTQLRPDGVFDHWTLFNISPTTTEIAEDEEPGTQGVHGGGARGYTGPCPPAQYEPTTHRYFFRLYALDSELPLQAGATKAEVLEAMEGHILEQTELMGTYKRR